MDARGKLNWAAKKEKNDAKYNLRDIWHQFSSTQPHKVGTSSLSEMGSQY